MKKHTRLFYRAVARIKAIGEENGVVLLDRLRIKLKTGYVRANKLRDELIEAKILREWTAKEFKGPTAKGNILWTNIGKVKIPRDISVQEVKRVKEERKKGLLPATIGELQKRSRSTFKSVIRP